MSADNHVEIVRSLGSTPDTFEYRVKILYSMWGDYWHFDSRINQTVKDESVKEYNIRQAFFDCPVYHTEEEAFEAAEKMYQDENLFIEYGICFTIMNAKF